MLVDDDGRPAACSGKPYRLGPAVADLDADVPVTPRWTDRTVAASPPMIFRGDHATDPEMGDIPHSPIPHPPLYWDPARPRAIAEPSMMRRPPCPSYL
jgi:hypothetical protein